MMSENHTIDDLSKEAAIPGCVGGGGAFACVCGDWRLRSLSSPFFCLLSLLVEFSSLLNCNSFGTTHSDCSCCCATMEMTTQVCASSPGNDDQRAARGKTRGVPGAEGSSYDLFAASTGCEASQLQLFFLCGGANARVLPCQQSGVPRSSGQDLG